MLEKFLTVPRNEFNRYLLDAPEFTEEEMDTAERSVPVLQGKESCSLCLKVLDITSTSLSDSSCASQLDGIDSRLPGTGVFDIKTRAAVPIRQDLMNHVVCPVWPLFI